MQPELKNRMAEPYLHIDQTSFPDSPMELVLRGLSGYVHQQEAEKQHWKQRCEEYEAAQQSLPSESIIPDGKQKELIAIFNAIYKAGYVNGISLKEFMERLANVFGCPGMANYAQALYNIKTAYKYDEIFDNLIKVAQTEKIG